MDVKSIERALWGMSGALMLVALVEWQSAALDTPPVVQRPVARASIDTVVTDSVLAEAEELTTGSDPFRLSNTPPTLRFDPAADATQANRGAQPAPLRPSLALKAIVGGPPWQAVVDGIPGQPAGTVIRSGIRYDRLLVRSVTRDSVVIQGPDTAWILTFAKRS